MPAPSWSGKALKTAQHLPRESSWTQPRLQLKLTSWTFQSRNLQKKSNTIVFHELCYGYCMLLSSWWYWKPTGNRLIYCIQIYPKPFITPGFQTHSSPKLIPVKLRYSYSINNCAEMVCGQDGSPLFLVSRSKNQFLLHREMPLVTKKWEVPNRHVNDSQCMWRGQMAVTKNIWSDSFTQGYCEPIKPARTM